MSVAIQEKILGFQVSIYDILCMEVFEGKCDLGGIELRYRIGEPLESQSACSSSDTEAGFLSRRRDR
jgi:hypothetical protein